MSRETATERVRRYRARIAAGGVCVPRYRRRCSRCGRNALNDLCYRCSRPRSDRAMLHRDEQGRQECREPGRSERIEEYARRALAGMPLFRPRVAIDAPSST
jgi:hypothetical protein